MARRVGIYLLCLSLVMLPFAVRPQRAEATPAALLLNPLGFAIAFGVGVAYVVYHYGAHKQAYEYSFDPQTYNENWMVDEWIKQHGYEGNTPVGVHDGSAFGLTYGVHPDFTTGDLVQVGGSVYQLGAYSGVGCGAGGGATTTWAVKVDATRIYLPYTPNCSGAVHKYEHYYIAADVTAQQPINPTTPADRGLSTQDLIYSLKDKVLGVPYTIEPVSLVPTLAPSETIKHVELVGKTQDGLGILPNGATIPLPGGFAQTFPEFDQLAPVLASTQAIDATNDDGDKVIIPPSTVTGLQSAGVPTGATITSVTSSGVATWQDANGTTGISVIDPSIAAGLIDAGVSSPAAASESSTSTAAASSETQTVAEADTWEDPPDPSDEDSGFDWDNMVLPDLNATVSMPDKVDIPASSWLDSVPIANIFSSSSITLGSPDPVLAFDINMAGVTGTKTVDFSQWESIFILMGQIILAISTYRAILLATTKNVDL